MRAVIVEDEKIMIRSFIRYTSQIEDFEIVGTFQDPLEGREYILNHPVDVAFLDIEMPELSGVELARQLKSAKPNLLIVFLTAYSDYIRESNDIGVDYYIMKPYTAETMTLAMERMRKLLPAEDKKAVRIKTFGRFVVFVDGKPISLVGKTKEILALLVANQGREISNEELYTTIWENRECDNVHMKVYYNALKRLKVVLEDSHIPELLISTKRGQLLNTEVCDCDYYRWLAGDPEAKNDFHDEFMSEYSWSEPILARMIGM